MIGIDAGTNCAANSHIVLTRVAPEFRGASFSNAAANWRRGGLRRGSIVAVGAGTCQQSRALDQGELPSFPLSAADGEPLALGSLFGSAATVYAKLLDAVSVRARMPAERHARPG
jgi:hypothetical protein